MLALPHTTKERIMDLNDALKKHSEWKLKFRIAISKKETMDAATISKDDCCGFGEWLHGEVKSKLNKFPSFSECVTKHAAFHIEAGKVAKAVNDNKYEEATAMIDNLDTPYTKASSAFGVAIMHLRKEAGLK
jgi:methyl-accepting chemotaxis protein